ncbi:hypothetical protein EOD42_02040 [Rhodovarius crocodyli]|uniref:Lactonase family protein n=1 Tax=Rhodovarius crocodyli TaxID=1979269 RepID=A0A437MMN9_9PROT|nr:beta-propeller fold lactonase family protein [Rhodovarius crocodyli]RVT98915.1 hypothetical protein EOD42_02040 [Rhodovarius crocodyli]
MRFQSFSLSRRGAVFLGAALASPAIPSRAQEADALAPVSASRIAAISDGDFLASTFTDGVLPPFGAHRDLLTLFTRSGQGFTRAALEVSNSATAGPDTMAASPDGQTLYVVDRLERATPEATRVTELAPGRTLTTIRPEPSSALVATRAVPPGSEAVAASPDGAWLAVVGNGAEQATLALLPVGDGPPGEAVVYGHAALGFAAADEGPRGGVTLTGVQWLPDAKALALTDAGGKRLGFFRFDGGTLTPWGGLVATGGGPLTGRFVPGGRFYVTAEGPGRGVLGVMQMAEDGRHRRIAEVPADMAPRGLAVSRDGRLLAMVHVRGTAEASVSLLAFDPESGECRKLQEAPLEGLLPAGAAFDATGSHLLVTLFQGNGDQGALAVFRTAQQQLVPAGRVPLPHGAHHVVVCA